MNRILILMAGIGSASSLLLVDSAVKGAALLSFAAIAAVLLRRDSAATRHLVWCLAIVAMLILPVLSVTLPQWRVLPGWAGISSAPAGAEFRSPLIVGSPEMIPGASLPVDTTDIKPADVDLPNLNVLPPSVPATDVRSTPVPSRTPRQVAVTWNWINTIPLLWAIGFCVLLARLAVARIMLGGLTRRGTILWSPVSPSAAIDDPIVVALHAASAQLGLQRSVTLLVHPEKTIPVVWGILRSRMLLPAAARQWDGEQLRSVLLHELAHIKRRDTAVQLLAQIACAWHWFNPLVWIAAWRLHVERERACDDLVLASGVRPSAYAGHLLGVVTDLSPARWMQSCGLAMARKSSLEGRLIAVLSQNLNRRKVSTVLVASALLIMVSVAVPIAMLRAAQEPPTEPRAEKTEVEKAKPAVVARLPKHEYAQSLFRRWQHYARTDGKIPGALMGQMARQFETFVKEHPENEKGRALQALSPRLVSSRDWSPSEVVDLFDEISAIWAVPLGWLDLPLEFDEMRSIRQGQALPAELNTAAWGAPAENGLRAAWLLEPRAGQYEFGTVLKSRVLFHNSGSLPVVFTTETWHQHDAHTARDAKGNEIQVSGTFFTGVTLTGTYLLAPGAYCEVLGHGLAIGAGKYAEEFSTGSVGAIIEANVGDDVTLSHTIDAMTGGWRRPNAPQDLWKEVVADRVGLEGPMPAAVADREQLIRRVTLDLFGVSATPEEIAAFTNEQAPDALARLTGRLQAKARIQPWAGKLPTGETTFQVIPTDPNTAKKPRTAVGPGRYVLSDGVHLLVSQTTTDSERTNQAVIAFLSPDPKDPATHKPYEIPLPDGLKSYGMAWERGAGILWVLQKGVVRSVDFSNPADVEEKRIEPGKINDVPEPLRDALQAVFVVAAAPEPQASVASQGGEKLPAGADNWLSWGEPQHGLRAAFVIRKSPDGQAGAKPDLFLVVQNVSETPIHFMDTAATPRMARLRLMDDGEIQSIIEMSKPSVVDAVLRPREVAYLQLFETDSKPPGQKQVGPLFAEMLIKNTHQSFVGELVIKNAPNGAWVGKLVTGDTTGAVAAGQPQPRTREGRELLHVWQHHARGNGNFPGGLIAVLEGKVQEFIRNNTGDTAGDPYAKKMAPLVRRCDASRDWTPAELVSLLDDIAAVNSIPLETTKEVVDSQTFKPGAPLPAQLAKAPWGQTQPSGLRLAWLLEPQAAEYRLGTPLKARVLVHNAGPDRVVFRMRTWQQVAYHARDAKAGEIKVDSTYWTTLGRLLPFRLAPGEFIEVVGAGVGVGAKGDPEDWQQTRVGSWVAAHAGDDVTLTTEPVRLADWNEPVAADGSPSWWLEAIKAHLQQDLPLPADTEERTRLVYRAGRELFGTPLTTEEINAFVTDREPTALDSLAKRLAKRAESAAFAGLLTSGSTQFRVLPADPNAATRPRTASGPGRYTLAKNVNLAISSRPVGERVVNEAILEFSSADQDQTPLVKSSRVTLPDGYRTWAAAWIRGSQQLWIMERESLKQEKIIQVLERPAEFSFAGESLNVVCATLMDKHGIDIVIDTERLKAEGLTANGLKVSVKVNNVALKNALKLILDPLQLAYVVEDEVLKITTKAEADRQPSLRPYKAVRVYNISNPAEIQETDLTDPAKLVQVPPAILEALRATLYPAAVAQPKAVGPPAATSAPPAEKAPMKPDVKPPIANPQAGAAKRDVTRDSFFLTQARQGQRPMPPFW